MANTQSAKGNPASKRMGNARLKARRAECWKRGEARKELRRLPRSEPAVLALFFREFGATLERWMG